MKTIRAPLIALGMTTAAGLSASWLAVPVVLALSPTDAVAIVGRPFTPVSVAGVARRTTRREIAYTGAAVATTAAVATAAVVAAPRVAAPAPVPMQAPPPAAAVAGTELAIGATVATRPANCTTVPAATTTYFKCGGVFYKPYYRNGELVYVVSLPP